MIFPLTGLRDDTHEIVARTAFESYKLSLPEERRILLDRYELADVAFKVVGVGSVGTFCAIGLFVTRDDQTLLLQLKEAQTSVLAPICGTEHVLQPGSAGGGGAADHADRCRTFSSAGPRITATISSVTFAS